MTGYGQAQASGDGLTIKVEVQSLNSRYFDLTLRVGRQLQPHEGLIRKRSQAVMNRGKVTVSAAVAEDGRPAAQPKLDLDRIRQYRQLFETVRQETGVSGEISLDHYLSQNDIILHHEDEGDDSAAAILAEALEQALAQTVSMRQIEGANLAKDLGTRLEAVKVQNEVIREMAAGSRHEYLGRYKARIEELAGAIPLDEGRLLQEVAMLAEKRDIEEECTRMASHCELFSGYLSTDEATGKRMGFLLQEMGREINTIGSKSNSLDISHAVVELKDELERMREQVQNIL